MRLFARKVSAVSSGDYYQVLFDSDDRDEETVNPYDQPEPYLMLQQQFEFADGGTCYVESDDEDYIGHFKIKLLEFSATSLKFDIAGHDHDRVEVSFDLTEAELDEARPFVEIIFGLRDPGCDGQDFDDAL
jgi:hypothetical protein